MITKYSTTPTGTGTGTGTNSWAHHQHHQDQDQYGGGGWGLSWPPRFYTCNFCRREFRSAQALGGHMNVHRRDRARLRVQSPKMSAPPNPNFTPNLNLNLTPNPNPMPSPSMINQLPRYSKQVGPPQCAAIFNPKKLLLMRRPRNLIPKAGRGRGVVRLGLEIGIFDDNDEDDEDDQEEDLEAGLDLELRLGYNY